MKRDYLPSKVFMIRVGIILATIVVVFGIVKIYKYFKNKPFLGKTPIQVLVKDVVGKDTNNNGIADWEEYLWGLDPSKNGDSNKEFIMAKKKTLTEKESTPSELDMLSSDANEALSQEFFASIVALQQTGNLNEESIAALSEAIGQNVEAVELADIYTIDMVKTTKDSEDANLTYFKSFEKLLKKYEGEDIGNEMTLVSQGLGSNDPQALYAASSIVLAYKDFGSELIELTAPNSIAPIQVDLANSYEKTGQSLDGMVRSLSNPMVGMKSIINYKKYSDALVNNLDKLSEALQ